jgi:TonB family protein
VSPEIARVARVQGDVVMKALIDKTGDVIHLDVLSGPPMLTESALDAVQQWKYRPYLLQGQTVQVETQITVTFQLIDSTAKTAH